MIRVVTYRMPDSVRISRNPVAPAVDGVSSAVACNQVAFAPLTSGEQAFADHVRPNFCFNYGGGGTVSFKFGGGGTVAFRFGGGGAISRD
jgi:hypothetical protein